MPVHRSKKCTTSDSNDSTEGQSAPGLPSQQVFQQHLRELARGAIRLVLEAVMREELDALIGVGWGDSSPKRKGYRNYYYQRDLVTSSGRLADLNVPRDREGQFHTQVFDHYRRYEPQVAQGLSEMFVASTSTHKVGEVAQTLMGVAPSASAISRPNQDLEHQFITWTAPAASTLAHPLSGWNPFQRTPRWPGRCNRDPHSAGRGLGRKQRGLGEAPLCRGGQRWLGECAARPAISRSDPDGSHRHRRP